MTASLESADHVLLRFDIDEYVKEIHDCFVRNLLYRHFTEGPFHQLMIEILVPDGSIRELLSRDARRRIFAGVLRNLAANSGLPLQKLIKFYYEYLSLLQQPVNDVPPQEVLELFKEAVALLEREHREPKAHAAAAESILRHQSLLAGIVTAFGIRKKRQFEEIFSPALLFNYLFSLLLFGALAAVLILPSGIGFILTALEPAISSDRQPLLQPAALLGLGLLVLYATVRYRLRSQKRRLLTKCLNAVCADQGIRPEETSAFFRNRFGCEWGKRR